VAVLLAVSGAALVGCGGPDGPTPIGSPAGAASSAEASGGEGGASGAGAEAQELAHIGGEDLEVVAYPVGDALEAEGGDSIQTMLDELGIDPAAVSLVLAVAPGGDPAISSWELPGVDAAAILDAWEASAPGRWEPETIGDSPALVGEGVDGDRAWALAVDGRFVYVHTDEADIAEEVAAAIGQ
jgi:hypothetical protein